MTGAGFGGCTINLVRPDAIEALAAGGRIRVPATDRPDPSWSSRSTPPKAPAACPDPHSRNIRPHPTRLHNWPYASVTSRPRAVTSRFPGLRHPYADRNARSCLPSTLTESFLLHVCRSNHQPHQPEYRRLDRHHHLRLPRRPRHHRRPRLGRGVQLGQRGAQDSVRTDELRAPPGDDRLRPDRHDRAGPLRRCQARGRHVRRDPEGPARCDDRGGGQDLLGQRRVRPGRDRVRVARLAPRRQPRRLDDHPAARPQHPARRGPRPGPEPHAPSASSRRSSSRSGSPSVPG